MKANINKTFKFNANKKKRPTKANINKTFKFNANAGVCAFREGSGGDKN